MQDPPKTGWLRLFGTTTLFCLIPFVIYYSAGYRAVHSYLLNRNQRAVSMVAAHAQERLTTLHKVLSNSLYASTPESSQVTPRGVDEIQKQLSDRVDAALENNKLLKFRNLVLPEGDPAEGTSIEPTTASDGGTLRLVHISTPRWAELGKAFNAAKGRVRIEADISFEDFFGTLDAHQLFEEVAIVDSMQRVLRPNAAPAARLAQSLVGSNAVTKAKDTKAEDAATGGTGERSYDEVAVGGETYSVFRQRIQANLARSGAPDAQRELWVVGMVPAHMLQKQALTLGVVPLLWLLLGLLLALLAGPFVKVFLLGRHDPLRASDVHRLQLGLVFGVGVVVTALLSFAQLGQITTDLDRELTGFGQQLQAGLVAELSQAVAHLDSYRATVADEPLETSLGDLLVVPGGQLGYAGVQRLIAIDSQGRQISKRSIEPKGTPLIRVRNRPYFTEMQRGHFDVRCEQSNTPFCQGTDPYSLDVVQSRTTGETISLISMAADATAPAGKPAFVQLEAALGSLWNAVVPLGFGFALITADGQVLHHADTRRVLEENLFTVTEDDPALKTAVALAKPRALDVRYHGRDHRLHVIPLNGTPWTLAVFAETSYAQTLVLETALATLVSLSCLTLVLILLRLLRVGARVSSWMAPSSAPERVVKYRLTCAVQLAIAILQLTAAAWNSRMSVSVACVCAVFALLAVGVIVDGGERGQMKAWIQRRAASLGPIDTLRPSAATSYLTAVWSLLLVIAVLPAIAFWQDAFVVNRDALERMVQEHRQLQLESHDRALRAEYSEIANTASVLPRRLEQGVYPPRLRGERETPLPACPSNYRPTVWRELLEQLPAFNDTAEGLRSVLAAGCAPLPVATRYRLAGDTYDWRSASVSFTLALLLIMSVARVARRVLGLGQYPIAHPSGPTLARDAARVLHLCMPESGQEILKRALDEPKGTLHAVDLRRADLPIALPSGCTQVLLRHFESRLVGRDRTHITLEALEILAAVSGVKIAICSDIDPVYYLNEVRQDHKYGSRPNADKSTPPPSELPDVIRWAQLFSTFDRVHHATIPMTNDEMGMPTELWNSSRSERFRDDVEAYEHWLNGAGGSRPPSRTAIPPVSRPSAELSRRGLDEKAQNILRDECSWDEQLQTIARTMCAHHIDDTLSTPRLLQQITTRAAARHRYLWSLCTNTEKLVLVHLAREGTINPSNWSIVHMLAVRGLLRYQSGRVALPSRSFRDFVLNALRPRDLAHLEQQQPSTWQQVSPPLFAVLLLAIGFFLWSQPGITEPIMAVLGAGAAGTAALLRFLSTVNTTTDRPAA
jgi:hypothetical protein